MKNNSAYSSGEPKDGIYGLESWILNTRIVAGVGVLPTGSTILDGMERFMKDQTKISKLKDQGSSKMTL